MDQIYEKREKEQEKLNILMDKKEKLDERIKNSQKRIKQYTMMINQEKFSEINNVINSTGLSLEEVMKAIKSGNLLSLQESLQKNNKKELG